MEAGADVKGCIVGHGIAVKSSRAVLEASVASVISEVFWVEDI